MSDIVKIRKQYDDAKLGSDGYREHLNSLADLAYGRLSNAKDKKQKSRIREGSLSSLTIESTCRVAANLPTGKILSLTKKDEGKNQLINLFWNRYVLPNANSQYSMEIKIRMWDFYSKTYNIQPMLYFYRADDNYIGPDCRLIDPRYVFPQAGILSPNDAEYIFVEDFYTKRKLTEKIGKFGWEEASITEILERLSNESQPDTDNQTTNIQNDRGESKSLFAGQIKLVTKYKKGYGSEWVTFAPDFGDLVVRKIKNLSPSGRIPIVFKLSFPLLDSFYGLGDVERGESLQKGIDSSVNMGFDAGLFNVRPIVIFDKTLNTSQFPFVPGAKWRKNPSESIDTFKPVSNAAEITQSQYQFMKAALLNQYGTTDTTISATDKLPGFGKTPDALKKLDEREKSRDAFDRAMLEAACEELFEGMIELVGIRQDIPINFTIFDEEIREIANAGYKDVLDIFDSAFDKNNPEKLNGKGLATLNIKAGELVGTYKYIIDAGSTAANDQSEEYERVLGMIDFINSPSGQSMVAELNAAGKQFNYVELLEQYLAVSGIKNNDKLIVNLGQPAVAPLAAGQVSNLADGEMFTPEMLQDPSVRGVLQQEISVGGQV